MHGYLEFTFTAFITRQARSCCVADKLNAAINWLIKFERDTGNIRINTSNTRIHTSTCECHFPIYHRGYYTVARRYEFYFWVAKQYFTDARSEWVKYCFCHEKIKFVSSSRRVMFFLLYRQKDIDKIIEGNDRNYVIDKLTCEIMENKPLGSRM